MSATRAWQVTRLGDPTEVLVSQETDVSEPGPGQVRVAVEACALNFPDTLLARGLYQVRPEPPFTPGIELVGLVESVGEGVTSVAPGDRVLGMPALPYGALAGLCLMPAAQCFPAPASLSDPHAASLYVAYQTGWFGLHRRARLQAGETVLVHAAAGGVGSAAAQLAKAAGARVVGVVGGAQKVAVAQDLGCDAVVDRKAVDGLEGLVGALKQALSDLGARGFDVVYDPVGGDAFTASTKTIGFEGRIVVVGFTSGTVPQAAANHMLVKNYSVLGLHWGMYQQLDPASVRVAHDELTRLADEGRIDPLVSEVVGWDEVPDALSRLASGRTTGRVVVDVVGAARG